MQQQTATERKATQSYVNGAIAGVVEVIFTQPLDVYKTQLQNQLANTRFNTKHTPVHHCSPTFYNRIIMYYRGFGARLCAVVPMRLTFWGVQDVANTQLQTYTALAPATIGLCSGVVAGCAQTVVDAPTEWLKIQRITNSAQSSFTYSNAIKALLTYKHIPGFYPTLYRNVIVVCCLNTGLLCYGNISQHSTSPDNNIPGGNTYSTYFTVSVLSSLIGSFISHPFDVLKTSMQRANAPPRDTMFSLFRQYAQTNPLSLWTGVVPRCTHVMLSMGIGSVVFYSLK